MPVSAVDAAAADVPGGSGAHGRGHGRGCGRGKLHPVLLPLHPVQAHPPIPGLSTAATTAAAAATYLAATTAATTYLAATTATTSRILYVDMSFSKFAFYISFSAYT